MAAQSLNIQQAQIDAMMAKIVADVKVWTAVSKDLASAVISTEYANIGVNFPTLKFIQPQQAQSPAQNKSFMFYAGVKEYKNKATELMKMNEEILSTIFGSEIPEQVAVKLCSAIQCWYLSRITSLYEALDIFGVHDDECRKVFELIQNAVVESIANEADPNEAEAAFIAAYFTPTTPVGNNLWLDAPDLGPLGIFYRLEVKYELELQVYQWHKVLGKLLKDKTDGKEIVLANYAELDEGQQIEDIKEYTLGTEDDLDETTLDL